MRPPRGHTCAEAPAGGTPESLLDRAQGYLDRCKRTSQEARWFSLQLQNHTFVEPSQQMAEYNAFMEVSYVTLQTIMESDQKHDIQAYSPLFSVLDIKFSWFDQNRRTCKQMEQGMHRRAKTEPASPTPRPKKAKGKGKVKPGKKQS